MSFCSLEATQVTLKRLIGVIGGKRLVWLALGLAAMSCYRLPEADRGPAAAKNPEKRRADVPAQTSGVSYFTARPDDPQAVYLAAEPFGVKGDGAADDTDALQRAIDAAKDKHGYGILFIPEGRYRITRTLYVPKAVRLIGYGKSRPVIVLGKNTPGFQTADPQDKGQGRYMIWFVDRTPKAGESVRDAGAGTFYSGLENVDLQIEDGNPAAVALRTHFAQHSFVAHSDIRIGQGRAGIFDVGNEIEDVRFFGGQYGIDTTRTSPGWPCMVIDTVFEGQRKAAIRTQEAGLTILRLAAKDVPAVVDVNADYVERLYMQDCRFENIRGPALVISQEDSSPTQINLRNVTCSGVAVLAQFRQSGRAVDGMSSAYRVASFTHGLQMDSLGARAEVRTSRRLEPLAAGAVEAIKSDIPPLPPMAEWANLRSLGAKGDEVTDDTQALRDAIAKHRVIYLPQGRYRVTDTITLRPDTVLIGLHPIGTQIVIADNTEAFAGFGTPKPVLETPKGGKNIVYGIGLDAGGRNPRAVACKWMAGEGSYLNDVKFVGGHGGMNVDGTGVNPYNPSRMGDFNPDRRWDSQYWSLWVTDGGGGIFKDIWTASPYAAAGLYVSDTKTPGRIYGMSSEHHVRSEAIFRHVENWQVLALQTEEESAEGPQCLPLELSECAGLHFGNLYLFRTIWVDTPYPTAIRTWNSRDVEFANVHNFTQMKFEFDNTLIDMKSGMEVRPWELARLVVTGKEPRSPAVPPAKDALRKLAGGFEFIDALCRDSKGNVFFADSRAKRIYEWSPEKGGLRLVTELQLRPRALACDSRDNLLVLVEYFPPKGATIDGKPEVYPKPPDSANTAYGRWYNTGSTVKAYALDPAHPEKAMQPLKVAPMGTVAKPFKALYPASRWRDGNDYLAISVRRPTECFIAPDGVTIIPICYDLIRASSFMEAVPGKTCYGADEYYKRTVAFQVKDDGTLADPQVLAERGELSAAVDAAGRIWVPDGQLNVFSPRGTLLEEVPVPERPACVLFAGPDGKDLFITARSSLYLLRR
jgi:hypothetical protein